MTPLISFSLVKKQIGRQSFEMHWLMQLSTRKWLELHKELERWRKEPIRIMVKAFPSGNYETWTDCQVLLPHSKEAISYALSDKDEELNLATIAGNTGWYLYRRGGMSI